MKILKLLILLLLVGCEATFNSDLKQYIEDVSGRTPLKFALDSSFSIENEDKETIYYYSFGYSSLSKTDSLIFTNNESSNITIEDYTNDSQNFTIVATPSGGIQAGAQFTIDITYNPEVNSNKTVNDTLVITDSRNRKYEVVLLGSSKRQPLDIIFNEEVITGFDFGDKYINTNRVTFTLKNDSLTTLNIDPLTVPAGVKINSTGPFSIPIFESVVIELYYETTETALDDLMVINNDFSESNYIEFPLYGGKDLNLQIVETDSEGFFIKTVTDSYDFGLIDPTLDSERIKYFKITNNSDFEADISVQDPNNTDINLDFPTAILQPGESLDFKIYASKTLTQQYVSGYFRINDISSGRSLQFNVSIQVVPG